MLLPSFLWAAWAFLPSSCSFLQGQTISFPFGIRFSQQSLDCQRSRYTFRSLGLARDWPAYARRSPNCPDLTSATDLKPTAQEISKCCARNFWHKTIWILSELDFRARNTTAHAAPAALFLNLSARSEPSSRLGKPGRVLSWTADELGPFSRRHVTLRSGAAAMTDGTDTLQKLRTQLFSCVCPSG